MLKVFISHSSENVSVVEPLVLLIQEALGLRVDEVRCTSLDNYRLPGGVETSSSLREEIGSVPAFVWVISEASAKSRFVTFEIGARWGCGLPFIPLLAPGTSAEVLPGPMKGRNALAMNRSGLQQMVEQLAESLEVKVGPESGYQRYIEIIASAAESGVPRHAPQRRIRDFFAVGCGVGNRLGLISLDPEFDTSNLDEFMEVLTKIVPVDDEVCERILKINAYKENNDEAERNLLLMNFFEAMKSVPDSIRDASTAEEYAWFDLGRAHLELLIFAAMGKSQFENAVDALEMSLGRIEFPAPVKHRVVALLESARSGREGEMLERKVNGATQAILRFLE